MAFVFLPLSVAILAQAVWLETWRQVSLLPPCQIVLLRPAAMARGPTGMRAAQAH